jgi:ATP-dependent RNA helicase DeaD
VAGLFLRRIELTNEIKNLSHRNKMPKNPKTPASSKPKKTKPYAPRNSKSSTAPARKAKPAPSRAKPRSDAAARESGQSKTPTQSTPALNRAARRAGIRAEYAAKHGLAAPQEQTAPPIQDVAAEAQSTPTPKVAAETPRKTEIKKAEEKREPKKREEKKPVVETAATQITPDESANTEATGEKTGNEEISGFDSLGLSEPIARAITALGFEAPTPIQARAIPLLLQGRDIIGQAQTGTGKTAAFALPIIQNIHVENAVPQALVLAPTRELAVQVAGGIHDLAKNTGLRVVPVYGGQPIDRQFRALSAGAHIVVGTPGRVIDHLRRGSLSLETVTFCVLDEADEMLALGFLEDVEEILSALPEKRQTAFFSATMPPKIKALTKKFLQSPEHVEITSKKRTVESVEQTYYEVPKGKKPEALARVLDMETPGPTIVFCRTRLETNELSEALRLRGYNAEALNGEMSQNDRDRVLRRFKSGQADLLIATDVAARGLDIETVTHVINYDIPWDVEQYIHRIGRTGRAGRSGDAITLVETNERRRLKFIEQMTGVKMKLARIPTAADIAARRRDVFKDTLREALQAGEFDGELETVAELSEDFDTTEIAAAALHMLWESRHSEASDAADLAADHEQPETGMTRIFVGLGKTDGLRPGELVAVIANNCNISGRAIGAIDILDRSSFVEVPSDKSQQVMEVLRREKLRGRSARVDLATPRR